MDIATLPGMTWVRRSLSQKCLVFWSKGKADAEGGGWVEAAWSLLLENLILTITINLILNYLLYIFCVWMRGWKLLCWTVDNGWFSTRIWRSCRKARSTFQLLNSPTSFNNFNISKFCVLCVLLWLQFQSGYCANHKSFIILLRIWNIRYSRCGSLRILVFCIQLVSNSLELYGRRNFFHSLYLPKLHRTELSRNSRIGPLLGPQFFAEWANRGPTRCRPKAHPGKTPDRSREALARGTDPVPNPEIPRLPVCTLWTFRPRSFG